MIASEELGIIENEINKYQRIAGELFNGYLSDKLDEIINFLSGLHINILSSPASSGKTIMVENLNERGYRCLLFVPMKSIIKNKRLKGFAQVYGSTRIQKYLHTTESIICTFDKASQLKVEDFALFDYIIIDESHLLFTEGYRLRAMVTLLKKIKQYILNVRYGISDFTNSNRIVLMSGTLTGEEFYFGLDKNGESITQKKVFINDKIRKATLVGCEDRNACYTSFIKKGKELIDIAHLVVIPANMGEKWINCVKKEIGATKIGIYSNNQKNSQVSKDINTHSLIKKYIDLLFMTCLGNVGIDINNVGRPTTMLFYIDEKYNAMTGHLIEQYANRFRKINIEVFVFFVIPDPIDIPTKKFLFNYVESSFTNKLIENDVSTNLYENTHFTELMEGYKADDDRVRWKNLKSLYNQWAENIISIGGSLKSMGYDITVIEGDEEDTSITSNFSVLMKLEKESEKECKIRALEFILDNIDILIQNLTHYSRETGRNSILDETITIENEQLFNNVRYLVKYCVRIIGSTNHVEWIRSFMINEEMNFKDIKNRLKCLENISSNSVDYLDEMFVFEVDKLAKMKNGKGSITDQEFNDMLNILAPKYINKSFNDADPATQSLLREKLKEKLDICFSVEFKKKHVIVRQRYAKLWFDETINIFREVKDLFRLSAFTNDRKVRNRKGASKGVAIGDALGDAIGKAYQHIAIETIDEINEIVELDRFITAKHVIEITGLTSKSLGGFVKAKLPHLKSSVKMIDRVRETRYSK